MNASAGDQGGDPACWADRVCPECGAFREDPQEACRRCGTVSPAPADAPAGRRDRDAGGRPRNARPRDGLGRPLPYGTPGVERQPEGIVRPPHETLAEAQRLLDAGRPFHAHEVLEDAWKSSPAPERALWRALAQLAVGLTHALRGNPSGARTLLLRGADGVEPYGAAPPYGIDAAGLAAWARAAADRPGERPEPPRLRG